MNRDISALLSLIHRYTPSCVYVSDSDMTGVLQEYYTNHPMNLVHVVKNCLATETRLVRQGEMVSSDIPQKSLHNIMYI